MPWTSAPSATPWAKVATMLPPKNETSQSHLARLVRQRNSKATPRKISASNMAMIGA